MILDSNLFTTPTMKGTRDGYGEAVTDLAKTNKNIIAISADLTESLRLDKFRNLFPKRFIEVGIAEQNMMGIAAGLARIGKIPFVSTFGIFNTGRCWGQMRLSACYSNLNVKIGGSHTGLTVGEDGASHQVLEDIAITRVLPNMKVIIPCDFWQAKKAVFEAAKTSGPVYIRFSRAKSPLITKEDTNFQIGKAEILKDGKDAAIIACGQLVYESLLAAKKLKKDGIDVMVINNHSIKPLDTKTILKAAKTKAIVTAEEHQITGGMGSAIAEFLSQNQPTKMKMIGVKDTFGESGKPDQLMKKYGLTHKEIIHNIKILIK